MSDGRFKWLAAHAKNVYSQFGEDGIIDAILERIGVSNRWCFECGASDGLFFSNTRRLVLNGWSAILAENDVDMYNRLVANTSAFTNVDTHYGTLTEIDHVLTKYGAPHDIDLAVIDVDGQDYHLFNSMIKFRPRVVMVEFDPNADVFFIPERGGPGQAGFHAMARLLTGRVYTVVAETWANLIAVAFPLEQQLYEVSKNA